MALGATRGDVLRLTLGQALRLSAIGLLLGVGGSAGPRAARSRASCAARSTTEPAVLAAVVVLLGGAALVAAWIPARRALAVDPARALRSE